MKKRTQSTILAILLLMVAILVIRGLREDAGGKDSGQSQENAYQEDSETPLESSPRHQGKPSAGLQMDTPSKTAGALSSTVNAEIQAGETLVMGGYLNENNLHEFTMLTPSLVTMEDGSTMINIQSKVLNISPDFARKSGMHTLTTRYPTADQHAEAWSAEDLRSTLLKASSEDGVEMMSVPVVTAKPGQPASISIGGGAGQVQFAIETEVSTTARGGFSIQSRMVRTPREEP